MAPEEFPVACQALTQSQSQMGGHQRRLAVYKGHPNHYLYHLFIPLLLCKKSILWISHTLHIHSLSDGHLCHLQVLATIDKAAMNVLVHVSL